MNMEKFKTGRDGYISSLDGISVGDTFMIWEGKWDSKLVRVSCTHVTAKQCVIGSHKYRISDALGLGGDKWSHIPSLMLLDDSALKADQEKQQVKEMRRKLDSLNWNNIADGPVKAVFSIVWTGSDN
jgi:hypothetical protein